MRKAFTLIEINLAMMIMATGILTVVGLYAFGYRENRQSREDVAATALADAVVGQLMSAITSTNLVWSEFRQLKSYPDNNGWYQYFNSNGIVSDDPEPLAERVFSSVMSDLKIGSRCNGFDTAFPSAARTASGLSCGLVVMHEEDSPVVSIAFRATKQPGTLLAMPMFYCEGRFQGDPER